MYDGPSENITEIQGGKVECMHCPMFFRFNGGLNVRRAIVDEYELTEVREYPDIVIQLDNIIREQVEWWDLDIASTNSKIYWAYYESNDGSTFRLKILIANENANYVITDGFFREENYTRKMLKLDAAKKTLHSK